MKKAPLVSLARGLRRQQTDAEKLLWSRLRHMRLDGIKFRRQQPVGNYIVDFISFDKQLVIEVDGGQHNEMYNKEADKQRTVALEDRGFQILRFWNNDVLLNIDGVLNHIKERSNNNYFTHS